MRQGKKAVCPRLCLVPAFQTGGGAAQNDRTVRLLRPPHRQIARLIAQVAILFERRIVFFVHNHQRQIGQRGKHRQPRTDHQPRLPQHRGQIIAAAAGGCGLAVQHGHGEIGKTCGNTLQKLRSQIDFGQQKQHLPARRQRVCRRFKIHFGFSAAGDAVQQKRGKTACRADDGIRRRTLVGIGRIARRRDFRLPLFHNIQPAVFLPLRDDARCLRMDFFQRGKIQAA